MKHSAILLAAPRLHTVEMPAEAYISRYNRRADFEPLCRACPNWAARWGCPPFDSDPIAGLRKYSTVKLYCLTAAVEQWPVDAGLAAMTAAMQQLRIEWEPQLLAEEEAAGGFAALFTGMCYHCGERECARRQGQSCRFPHKVRPSLEALGFDLGQTAAEVFGCQLEWFHPGQPTPRQLTLLGAVFF